MGIRRAPEHFRHRGDHRDDGPRRPGAGFAMARTGGGLGGGMAGGIGGRSLRKRARKRWRRPPGASCGKKPDSRRTTMEPVLTGPPSPGISNEVVTFFRARGTGADGARRRARRAKACGRTWCRLAGLGDWLAADASQGASGGSEGVCRGRISCARKWTRDCMTEASETSGPREASKDRAGNRRVRRAGRQADFRGRTEPDRAVQRQAAGRLSTRPVPM